MKKWIIGAVPAALLLALSAFLLKGDVWVFWTWYLMAGVLGLAAMPATSRLFRRFQDRGWMFSKVLAIAGAGFVTWFLVAVSPAPFTMPVCIGVTVFLAFCCCLIYRFSPKDSSEYFPTEGAWLIFWEELLFFAVFLMWTYLAGFHPAAFGTEKFMDYGFMEAMMRSTELPAEDLWYAGSHINYYYGGQYFAVFLTKLSGSHVEQTYNLMRTFVAGFAFVLPFSLVYQLVRDRLKAEEARGRVRTEGFCSAVSGLAGLLGGFAVSITGNMHYVYYGLIKPWIQKLQGLEVTESYWFPDATRYIGYNPDVPDKTIHEFPCYSFVLGDLHAHVVNIMFVLLLIGILYSWTQVMRVEGDRKEEAGRGDFWKRQLLSPHLLTAAWLLGMFQWTNFWDFVIYYVVTGGTALFTNIVSMKGRVKQIVAATAAQAAEIMLTAYVVILPFTLKFKTMVEGVALAEYHSLPHQLLILWGLPVFLVILFLAALLTGTLRGMKKKNMYHLLAAIDPPDLFAVVTGLCAIGLVLIPEIVYVRDIYENGNARANTMFKLTYQAYILFGITMGYVIVRMLVLCGQKLVKGLSAAGLALLLMTGGYFVKCADSWFGGYQDPSQYQGLDATAYIETDFPEDAAAIRWLKANIEGSPVVLEANGDSYSATGFQRVSAMTGLPTILGWYVHEWLWRNDVEDLNRRSADVETIYTSQDEETVKSLLSQYQVSYIFVGAREREKYEDRLNDSMLRQLGSVVFEDGVSGTYILQVELPDENAGSE